MPGKGGRDRSEVDDRPEGDEVDSSTIVPLPAVVEGDDPSLEFLKRKIHEERGFNGHFYKDKCLRRRLAVRMRARGEPTFDGYAALLDRDPVEWDALLEALTINVTKFFRNAEVWELIAQEAVPSLFDGDGERRVWSAGCASGEEIYSVSILLREYARAHEREEELSRFRLLGTDIDLRSLQAAERGIFPQISMGELPDGLQERWFHGGSPYTIDPRIREGVSFEWRDLISGEPERNQDLILCRNVIIYFDRAIQEALFDRFYEALAPGGYLVLGKVETLLGRTRSLFRPVGNRQRVFRKPA